MEETYLEILDVAFKLEEERKNLLVSQNDLHCVLRLVLELIKLMETSRDILLIESVLSPGVFDMENQVRHVYKIIFVNIFG